MGNLVFLCLLCIGKHADVFLSEVGKEAQAFGLMSVFSGYRTFCVFFNANGASVYRASLAFIFSEMIFEGGQKVL
mgnify:CR=1 FL=1